MEQVAEDGDHSEIRRELERVCASREFERSPQLAKFLSFIVEETLAGRGDKIKGYTIGTLALGRLDAFDPNANSIVRVEARRLREALGNFYANSGSDEQGAGRIQIHIPLGSYKPQFIRRAAETTEAGEGPGSAPSGATGTAGPQGAGKSWWRQRPVQISLASIFALLLLTALPLFFLQPANISTYRPKVLISLELSNDAPLDSLAIEARSVLEATIARFDETQVVTSGTSPIADYRIQIKAVRELSGLICVEVVVYDLAARSVILSVRRGIRDPGLLTDVVRALAVEIADPSGVIMNAEGAKGRKHFRCFANALRIRFEFDQKAYLESNSCLDSVLKEFPEDALALAYKSFNFSVLAIREVDSSQERARLAREAQVLGNAARAANPQSARSSQALARSLFAGGNAAEGGVMIERALELNPSDPTIQTELGVYRIATGRLIEGRNAMRSVCTKSFRGPEWVVFYCYIADAMTNSASTSVDLTKYLFNERYDLGVLTRVLRALDNEDMEAAQSLWSNLVSKDADWQEARKRAWLRRSVPANVAGYVDQRLAAAGLGNVR